MSLHVHTRTFFAGMLSVAIALTAFAQEGSETPALQEQLNRIEKAHERLSNTSLPMGIRSDALDDAIEIRDQIITAYPNNQQRAIWHGDQAEDLLLRRLSFPQDWPVHLLNADAACPLMPPEIPIILANGIKQAATAREFARIDIRAIEEQGIVIEDPTKLSLLERLRFERDLRTPLLEAIGLVLASEIDANAAARALTMLDELRRDAPKNETTDPIIESWHIKAMIAANAKDQLQALGIKADNLESDYDRVRFTALMTSPRAAASLAARRFQIAEDNETYRKMILGDLRERFLAEEYLDKQSEDSWNTERGDLWIKLLSSENAAIDASLDAALAARLTALAEELEPDDIPLAAAWALGQQELIRRTPTRADSKPRMLLEAMAVDAPTNTPLRARALSTLAQLMLADGDRLDSALIEEQLYIDYPDSSLARPERVADLIEPWALRGDEDATERYEQALRASIRQLNRTKDRTPQQLERQQERLLQLAAHLAQTHRGAEAAEIYEAMNPVSASIAASLLELRARNIHQMHTTGVISDNDIRARFRTLRSSTRSLISRFGSSNPELRTAKARAGLYEARSCLQLEHHQLDIERIEEIADDSNLDTDLRIDAYILRHDFRMADPITRQDAMVSRPDLLKALRLDNEIAGRKLIKKAQGLVEKIDSLNEQGKRLEAETLAANRLKPVAKSLDSSVTRSATLPERVSVARVLQISGDPSAALQIWDALAEEEPTAYVIIQGRADALFALGSKDQLGEAMLLYRQLGQGNPGEYVPKAVWWHAQLRQLLILEQVNRSLDRIAPRIERLRLQDPSFGGPRFRDGFEALLVRRRQGS